MCDVELQCSPDEFARSAISRREFPRPLRADGMGRGREGEGCSEDKGGREGSLRSFCVSC